MTGDSPGGDLEVVIGRGRTRFRRRWGDDLHSWNLTSLIRARFRRGWGGGVHLNPVGFIRERVRRRLGNNVYDRVLFKGHARTTRRGLRGEPKSLGLNPLPRPEGRQLPFLEKCVPEKSFLLRT